MPIRRGTTRQDSRDDVEHWARFNDTYASEGEMKFYTRRRIDRVAFRASSKTQAGGEPGRKPGLARNCPSRGSASSRNRRRKELPHHWPSIISTCLLFISARIDRRPGPDDTSHLATATSLLRIYHFLESHEGLTNAVCRRTRNRIARSDAGTLNYSFVDNRARRLSLSADWNDDRST